MDGASLPGNAATMKPTTLVSTFALAVLVLTAALPASQDQQPTFRTGANTVAIYATVTEGKGAWCRT
jgi:hypothetical protein